MTRAAPKRIWADSYIAGMLKTVEQKDAQYRREAVEYIRADLVRACMPANWRESKHWRAVAKAMGGSDGA